MKVFLGWSGPRSKRIAEALGNWLRQVIQAVEPWISTEIQKGARWRTEVADHLEEATLGIICITPENKDGRWLLFEAGALSKTRSAQPCTFLFDLTPSDVEEPLAQFQHTLSTQEDIKNLVRSVNTAVAAAGERALEERDLDQVFDLFWPRLERELSAIRSEEHPRPAQRSERELLEEILTVVRGQEQRLVTQLRIREYNEARSLLLGLPAHAPPSERRSAMGGIGLPGASEHEGTGLLKYLESQIGGKLKERCVPGQALPSADSGTLP